jgi:hypothetical protein
MLKERKIGTTFEMLVQKKFKVVEGSGCHLCYFSKQCAIYALELGICSEYHRQDGKPIYFIEIL